MADPCALSVSKSEHFAAANEMRTIAEHLCHRVAFGQLGIHTDDPKGEFLRSRFQIFHAHFRIKLSAFDLCFPCRSNSLTGSYILRFIRSIVFRDLGQRLSYSFDASVNRFFPLHNFHLTRGQLVFSVEDEVCQKGSIGELHPVAAAAPPAKHTAAFHQG